MAKVFINKIYRYQQPRSGDILKPACCWSLSEMQRKYRRSPSRSESPTNERNIEVNRSYNEKKNISNNKWKNDRSRSRSRERDGNRDGHGDGGNRESRWNSSNNSSNQRIEGREERGGAGGDFRQSSTAASNRYNLSSNGAANEGRKRSTANPSDSFNEGSIYKGIILLSVCVNEVLTECFNVITSLIHYFVCKTLIP